MSVNSPLSLVMISSKIKTFCSESCVILTESNTVLEPFTGTESIIFNHNAVFEGKYDIAIAIP